MKKVLACIVLVACLVVSVPLQAQDPGALAPDPKVAALEAQVKALQARLAKAAPTAEDIAQAAASLKDDAHKIKASPVAQACRKAGGRFEVSADMQLQVAGRCKL
jgi:hypothetical protein